MRYPYDHGDVIAPGAAWLLLDVWRDTYIIWKACPTAVGQIPDILTINIGPVMNFKWTGDCGQSELLARAWLIQHYIVYYFILGPGVCALDVCKGQSIARRGLGANIIKPVWYPNRIIGDNIFFGPNLKIPKLPTQMDHILINRQQITFPFSFYSLHRHHRYRRRLFVLYALRIPIILFQLGG